MFLTLLIVTFIVATIVSIIVARAFSKPIDQILTRIIGDEISSAWRRYVTFAIYVVGISTGVEVYNLQQYVTPPQYKDAQIVVLSSDRWILEVYRTIIGTLQGIAWVLLIFFIFSLIAFVVVRVFEMKKSKKDENKAA
jgi:hypothetical protein